MKYYAGLDLGGTFIKCGIVSEEGEIIAKDKIPTNCNSCYDVARDAAAVVKALCERTGVKVEAAGIGSPGTIDSEHGVVVYSNNLRWHNAPLAQAVEEATGLKTYVLNDANAAALGESFCGAGKNYKNSVLVTLGTGVGGGIIVEGKLFEGGHSAGAEIGHTVIRAGGERCPCGRLGCFEAYASATALIRDTKRAMQNDIKSVMWQLCGGDSEKADGKTAFDGMRAGDKSATQVVNDYIENLAEGIANIINIFRPEVVLLGGGVSAEGDYLIKPLEKAVAGKVFAGNDYAPAQIKTASLKNDAGLCGAAKYAMR